MEKDFSPLCRGHWLVGYMHASGPAQESQNTKGLGGELLGKKGFLGSWRECQGYVNTSHMCKTVSKFRVFVRGRAHGCGTGPELLST